MTDWAEMVARADAHRLPPSDYGSTRAIQNVASLLRAAYQRGRDEVTLEQHAYCTEVEALRAERDTLLAEKKAYDTPAWIANEQLNEQVGALLTRVARLEELVRSAYAEGWVDGGNSQYNTAAAAWEWSAARAALSAEMP